MASPMRPLLVSGVVEPVIAGAREGGVEGNRAAHDDRHMFRRPDLGRTLGSQQEGAERLRRQQGLPVAQIETEPAAQLVRSKLTLTLSAVDMAVIRMSTCCGCLPLDGMT